MVLTRAFACATPVVASDIPGYRDVMTPETAIAVEPDDPDALVDGVAAILADEPRRAAMGAAARRLAIERYSWTRHRAPARGASTFASRGGTRGGPREAARRPGAEPVGPWRRRARAARAAHARRLVAGPGVGRRLPRVRLRQLALDRRRRGAEPPLGAGARLLLAPDDRTGATGPETARSGTSSPRSASGCSATRCSRRGRESSRVSPFSAVTSRTARAPAPRCSARSSPTGCSTSSRSPCCASTSCSPRGSRTGPSPA